MSEQKQRPPVWLIWDSDLRDWADNTFECREDAEAWANGDDVVELIAREDAERLIAEAIAAERERLRGELGVRVPLAWRSTVLMAFDAISEVTE